MLVLQNVKKSYRSGEGQLEVLHGVSFTIASGESVAIQGRSGAGKTTLLNVLGCLDSIDSGRYQIFEEEPAKMTDAQLAKLRNEKIGFVLQDFSLLNERTVLFNVMLPLYFDQTPRKQMQELALRALESVGIPEKAQKRVNQLSGGQQQRVAIAREIIKQPSLLLADEPTGALDSQTAREIMELLKHLNQNGQTLIVVTHDDAVASYCGRRIVIEDGKIIDSKT
ncbi:MAG: ABC transporter ATP-binding protein [Oscillospiraceae bacterium]|nr:ABC transporter ATP-binding protein [Oscillospiraceae bacterium]